MTGLGTWSFRLVVTLPRMKADQEAQFVLWERSFIGKFHPADKKQYKLHMKLSQFKFNLPDSLLASDPAEERDEARLMVLHKDTGKIEHKIFKDVLNYFDDKDVMILNNTKVFPARLYGNKEKTGATIEVFLLRELNKELRLWDVLVDPARKIRVGNKLYFGDDDLLVAEVVDNTTSRGRTIRFLFDGTDEEFRRNVEILGETPLPKYIKRKATEMDKERYQKIF